MVFVNSFAVGASCYCEDVHKDFESIVDWLFGRNIFNNTDLSALNEAETMHLILGSVWEATMSSTAPQSIFTAELKGLITQKPIVFCVWTEEKTSIRVVPTTPLQTGLIERQYQKNCSYRSTMRSRTTLRISFPVNPDDQQGDNCVNSD